MVTVADAIAIKLLGDNCLLAGIGNELHAYFLDDLNLTTHKRIRLHFRSKIYGIYSIGLNVNSQLVLVRGGREIALGILNSKNDIHIIKQLSLNEWISAIHPYASLKNNNLSICVLTGKNAAVKIEISSKGRCNISERSSCADRCTLYSSYVTGSSWPDTIILCGNAFGELIIWKTSTGDVLHKLSGHNGVIFSIGYSMANHIITTTSDDRSVKIWNISYLTDTLNWSKCVIKPIKSLFGHTSRIFNHKIVIHLGVQYIISVGEDSFVCIWSMDGELVHKESINPKAPLWNLEYDTNRQYIFVCGCDGNIHQIQLTNILDKYVHTKNNVYLTNFVENEYATKLAVLQDANILVVVSDHQRIYFSKRDEIFTLNGWKLLQHEIIRSKITLLETYQNCIGFADNHLVNVYKFEDGIFRLFFKSTNTNQSIRSLKFLSENELILCDKEGCCTLINMLNTDPNLGYFQLPKCKERWITASCRDEHFLLVADRCGNIHLYEINQLYNHIELRFTLKCVHGKNLGTTSINRDPKKKLQFTTTGHDSKLRRIAIDSGKKQLVYRNTYDIPIKWCEKVFDFDTSLFFVGFNDSHFVIWKNDNNFQFELNCGGGHRYWDLLIDKQTWNANLYFIRNRNMFNVNFKLKHILHSPFDIPIRKWHSRPCNIVRTVKLENNNFLTVSGGDDNLLKFNKIYITDGNSITTKEVAFYHQEDIVQHISNIRAVFILPDLTDQRNNKTNKFLVFSAGGRAQICITEIRTYLQTLQLRELNNFMLRSDDLKQKFCEGQITYIDPETRFMSLIAFHNSETNSISIFVACSDGFIRQFEYVNETITLKASALYGRCILHVYHFVFINHNFLLTMSTDGLVAFWLIDQFSEYSTPFFTIQHHDSGVNCFDIFIVDTNKMFLASGGDDQAIALSVLKLNKSPNGFYLDIIVEKIIKYKREHTSQVNGIQFCSESRKLYTVGVDQKVNMIDLNDYSIKQIGFTCVSDVKGLTLISEMRSILVYGCGFQLIRL